MKNLWSLEVGEAVVAGKLSKEFPDYQVFIPLNSQLKEIDLILGDLNKGKHVTIQVKASSQQIERGKRQGWFTVKENNLFKPEFKVDYYVFLIYALNEKKLKCENHFIIVPYKDLKEKARKKKVYKNGVSFHFKVEGREGSKKATVHDARVAKNKTPENYSKYLDNFEQLEEHFKK